MSQFLRQSRGPFTADQLRSGDPYELSNGHTVSCLPTGGRGSGANAGGASVIGSDPDVESVGVDAGFAPEPGTLRAPDVAVGVSDGPGWTPGAPPLAVEYADRGQDEDDLRAKIEDLLKAGTRFIWVVRLEGPRRVEVHTPDEPMRLAHPDEELTAPGILRNPVPVLALYEKGEADRVTLRNLLQREGYEDLDAVLASGHEQGMAAGREQGLAAGLKQALREVLSARGLGLDADQRRRLEACDEPQRLQAWLTRAATATDLSDLSI